MSCALRWQHARGDAALPIIRGGGNVGIISGIGVKAGMGFRVYRGFRVGLIRLKIIFFFFPGGLASKDYRLRNMFLAGILVI